MDDMFIENAIRDGQTIFVLLVAPSVHHSNHFVMLGSEVAKSSFFRIAKR